MKWNMMLIALFAIALALASVTVLAEDESPEPVLISAGTTETTDTTVAAETADVELQDAGTLPDSPLYGLKLFVERVQTMFTFSEQAKIRLKVKFAERRLAEAEQMALSNRTEIVQTLMQSYQNEIQEANQVREQLRERNVTADDIDEWMNTTTDRHIAVLQRVIEKAPEQAISGLQNALQNAVENRENIRERLVEKVAARIQESVQEHAQEQAGEQAQEQNQERVNETAEAGNLTASTNAAQAKSTRTRTTLAPI
jgi:hypothetical protein